MMDRSNYWPMLCTGMWTAAVGLMAYATLSDTHAGAWWAVMISLAASLVTGRIIVNNATANERVRVEEIAMIVAREMTREDDVLPMRR